SSDRGGRRFREAAGPPAAHARRAARVGARPRSRRGSVRRTVRLRGGVRSRDGVAEVRLVEAAVRKLIQPVAALLVALALGAPDASATETPASGTAGQDAPAIGQTIPGFDAQKVDGGVEHVAFPTGGSTVLLFFLSGCPTCHKMLPQ